MRHHRGMRTLEARNPLWPAELARLQSRLRIAPERLERERARSSLWCLLVEVLERLLRGYAHRAGAGGDSEVEDLASEKALGLLARAESGAWDLSGRSPGEIVQYLARAARNGWLDHVAAMRREPALGGLEELDALVASAPLAFDPGTSRSAEAEAQAEGAELAAALRECIAQLAERDRRVWFYRVYYELSSRDIAAHPEVGLRVDHVDVINQRTRDTLRRCMGSKGHDLVEFPREAFVELWEMLESVVLAAEAGAPAAKPRGGQP